MKTHAVISIHPMHVARILNGEKSVEIRTRRVTVSAGSSLWIYSTLPVGAIVGVAEVAEVFYMSPSSVWNTFKLSIGLTRQAFRTYVNGSDVLSVIHLRNVKRLGKPVGLARIRRTHGFQPPQFFTRLAADHSLLRLLKAEAAKKN